MVIAALFACEELHCFLLRTDGVKALPRLAEGNLFVALPVQHQKGTSYFLHNTVKLERLKASERVVL